MSFLKEVEDKLQPIPSEWRKTLLDVFCTLYNDTSNCIFTETVTTLSDFYIEENTSSTVCIDYTDEKGVISKRCFDPAEIMNQQLNLLNPRCVISEEIWVTLTYAEKIDLLINRACTECIE